MRQWSSMAQQVSLITSEFLPHVTLREAAADLPVSLASTSPLSGFEGTLDMSESWDTMSIGLGICLLMGISTKSNICCPAAQHAGKPLSWQLTRKLTPI